MHTMIDPLKRALQVAADRTAIIDEDRRISYKELWSRCSRLVSVLRNAGAEAGDRIAILAANSSIYIETYVAVPAAGFVIVPLNTRHAYNLSLISQRSGNTGLNNDSFRNSTPSDPPVPRLLPMVRSTILTWR